MGIKEILGKMMDNAKQTHDDWGQPIQDESMEEKLLRKHLERERKKKVKAALAYYDRKHWKEMTSIQMPYHKAQRFKRKPAGVRKR